MATKPPGPLSRSNYLSWPPGPYNAEADPNSAAFNPANVIPASGIVSYGDVALDAEQYTRALERLHGAGLHGAGVAYGLQLRCAIGQPNITVLPGLALDSAGRHIYLAAGGQAEVGPNAATPNTPPDPRPVTAAGVVFPTAQRSGDLFLVAQWRETWSAASYASDPNISQYNDTPWLQLVAAADYKADLHVILGKVTLDATGKVTAASYGDAGGLQRASVSVPAQSLELRRAVNTAGPGADSQAFGSVRAREAGGLELTVANASDQISLQTMAGQTFSNLAVAANVASFGTAGAPGVFLKGYEATVDVGAPGKYGEVVVRDGANHLAISLVGKDGHIVVGGPTLNGKIRMLNHNAAETMTLDGATGSATLHRIKEFGAAQGIDVDANALRIHAADLVLDGRSRRANRALVDWSDQLIVNFNGDYGRGVEIHGAGLKVDGVLRDGGGVPLMASPVRKVAAVNLFASGSRVTQDVDLGFARPFMAYCVICMIDSSTNFDYDNAAAAEVYSIDGNVTYGWVFGAGNKFGNSGDDNNVHAPLVTGTGRFIRFRVDAIGPDISVAAVGVVFYE